ncbi:MAG: glycine cleavage system protein GcvH [Planctomycetia bacterium]|jgi:glycine cleavage system H protein
MRPNDRRYTETHEWAKIEGEMIVVGITDHAVQALSNGNVDDLVYCDLPESGLQVEAGQTFGEIESVKAVSDLNAPVAGEVADVNVAIEDHLEVLSKDPWGAGWMIKIKPQSKSLDHLMDARKYEEFLAAQTH